MSDEKLQIHIIIANTENQIVYQTKQIDNRSNLISLFQQISELLLETDYNPYGNPFVCPLCGKQMSIQSGKFGGFYTCTTWSTTKCQGIRNGDGTIPNKVKQLMPIQQQLPDEVLDTIELE